MNIEEQRQSVFLSEIPLGECFDIRFFGPWHGGVELSGKMTRSYLCKGFCTQSSMDYDGEISPHIHTTDLVTPSMSGSDPQVQCDELIHNENVDKETAIRIYKLYTTMVTAHQNCESKKKHEMACLKHEISILSLSSQGKETMEGLTRRLNAVETRFETLENEISKYTQSLQDMQTQLSGIEMRLSTTKKR